MSKKKNTSSAETKTTCCPFCDPPRCPHCGRELSPYAPVPWPQYPPWYAPSTPYWAPYWNTQQVISVPSVWTTDSIVRSDNITFTTSTTEATKT